MNQSTPTKDGKAAKSHYDVAILGTDLAASSLAAILARHGTRVVMIGEGSHPRFAIGETTIATTSMLFRVLADRYGVPELGRLTGFKSIYTGVTRSIGAESCHGFVYQREGRAQNPAEAMQISPPKGTPPAPILYRPDIDAYVFYAAIAYGAEAHQQAQIAEVDLDDDGVTVSTTAGKTFRARYLVDASGPGSAFVTQLGLREEPTRLELRSRSLYTHMVNVRSFDEVARPATAYKAPVPWSKGSMYHLFDGGYLWINPFGNHPGATNITTSVGLTLDSHRFPRQGSPEQEFRSFLERFPTIAPQFENARPVQPWIATDRQQYSSTRTVGDRWCVIAGAAGYVDPFLSRSLINTLEVVNVLAWRLLAAVRDGDFSAERFEVVQRYERQLLDGNDALVRVIFDSLREHALWNAVLRVMEVGFRYTLFLLQDAHLKLQQTGSDAALRELENAKYLGALFPTHDGYQQLFATTAFECAAVTEGKADATAASQRIFALMQAADFVPAQFGLSDSSARFLNLTPLHMARTALWAMRSAPPEIGSLIRASLRSAARQRRSR